MKLTVFCWFILLVLFSQPVWSQAGLKGEYYVGTNFDRKVFTRIDPQINFSWFGRTPAPNMPKSYYSIRWTGKLLAPATGRYTFSARVDDGIRLWVGNRQVVDSWQLNDSKNLTGTVTLKAGQFYDLRVDYFNDMLEGEIELYWQRPDDKPSLNPFASSAKPIPADFFFQKAVPNRVTVVSTPTKPAATTPVAAGITLPKATPQRQPTVIKPVPAPRKVVRVDTPAARVAVPVREPVSTLPPDLKPGDRFILPQVQFEQSSYVLLPESSAELNKVAQALKTNPAWRIHILGHTDNIGDPRLNLALSENRAKVVARYLTRQGVADERITTEGVGGKQPVADNNVEHERSKNRRVEIVIR